MRSGSFSNRSTQTPVNSPVQSVLLVGSLCFLGFATGSLLRFQGSWSEPVSHNDATFFRSSVAPTLLESEPDGEKTFAGLSSEETARLREYLDRELLTPEARNDVARYLGRWGLADPVSMFTWWRKHDYRYVHELGRVLEWDDYSSLITTLVETDPIFAFEVLKDWSGDPGLADDVAVRLIQAGAQLDAQQAKALIDKVEKAGPLVSGNGINLLGVWLDCADPEEARAYLSHYTNAGQFTAPGSATDQTFELEDVLSDLPAGQYRDSLLEHRAFDEMRQEQPSVDTIMDALSGMTDEVAQMNTALLLAERLAAQGHTRAAAEIVDKFDLAEHPRQRTSLLHEEARLLLTNRDFSAFNELINEAPSDRIAQNLVRDGTSQIGATNLAQALAWISDPDFARPQDREHYARWAIYANANRADPISAIETVTTSFPELAPALDLALDQISDIGSITHIFENQIPMEYRETLAERYIQRKDGVISAGQLADLRRRLLEHD